MPETVVLIYSEDGEAPLLEWLDQQEEKVQDKCIVRIERLRELGHELRRPEADFLRDGIYELRMRHRRVNFRILYFFAGAEAVLSHGLTKEGKVPEKEIDLAISHKTKFQHEPEKHTHVE